MSELQKEREQAVHLRRLGHSTAEVAAELERSPQWVRACWRRYQQSGWDGLADKSRAPHQHGTRLSDEVRQAVQLARSELEGEAATGQGLKYIGGRAIRTRLREKKVTPLPSVRTIERILAASQMTHSKTSQPKIDYPTLAPSRAQQLCQIDHLPHFLQGGQKVYCFNAIDVVSRYPTGQVYSHRRASDAAAFLWHVWQTIGIPTYTQVDNEGCFSGGFTHPYVLGQCVRLALRVGTQLLFSPVGHPQSNGSVERFHQDYQLHVWQDTYLADQEAVQSQADLFFDRYRHSHHHSTLPDEQTPALVHQQGGPPHLLPAAEPLPTDKLPLYAGQLHFMRQLQPDGTVSVLNVAWPVPNPQPLRGVWVTLTLSVDAPATLSIYDDAPDVPTRTRLISYPFPLKEPVLPRPQTRPATSDPQPVALSTPLSDPVETSAANFTFWQWLPVDTHAPHASRQLLRASLQFTSAMVNAIAETIY